MNQYNKPEQTYKETNLNQCLKETHDILNKAKHCFLGPQVDEGFCDKKLVRPIIEIDDKDSNIFRIWIGTRTDSKKVDDVWDNPNIKLAFEDSRKNLKLVIYGNAYIEMDTQFKKKYWFPAWKLFSPNGPKNNIYIAIRIEPTHLELVNFKQKITSESFDLKTVKFNHKNGEWETA